MYLRFVVSKRDKWTGAESGFFGPAYAVKHRERRAPAWIRDQICAELAWFDEHLDKPKRLERSAGRRGWVYGVCWFRPEATEAISRARYVSWLLTETGIPVREHKRAKPGEIIWKDAMQVVAKPPRDLPLLFR